jgi:hypothetical protein
LFLLFSSSDDFFMPESQFTFGNYDRALKSDVISDSMLTIYTRV